MLLPPCFGALGPRSRRRNDRRAFIALSLSHQQAFNATAVVRHMRRLQLGSSAGSSADASNTPSRPRPAQGSQSQLAPPQNAAQTPQNTPAGKPASLDSNNVAAARKECK